MVSHQFLVSSSDSGCRGATATRRRPRAAAQRPQTAPAAVPIDPRPLREAAHPGWITSYYWLWRRSAWEVFLRPPKEASGGRRERRATSSMFEMARNADECKASTSSLQDSPGVYEFAICRTQGGRRFKVYVGESSNVRRRHHTEYRGPQGGHLRQFFEDALADGYTVMRRVKYVGCKEAAAAREANLLQTYNYAWNTRQNAGCSRVKLETQCCCRIVARRSLGR